MWLNRARYPNLFPASTCLIVVHLHHTQGIEPLLDHLFSFLRRKTDFFVGATPEVIEETVMNVIKKHAALAAKAEADKKAAREKELKLKKARELKKKVL